MHIYVATPLIWVVGIRRILGKQGDYSGERESVVLDGYASVGFLVYEFIDEISSGCLGWNIYLIEFYLNYTIVTT